MRQAMIRAAQSASAQASSGATVLANSAAAAAAAGAAGTTAAAGGTKILLFGLFFGIVAAGGSLWSTVAVKEELLSNNNNHNNSWNNANGGNELNETLPFSSTGGKGDDGMGSSTNWTGREGMGNNHTGANKNHTNSSTTTTPPTCPPGQLLTHYDNNVLDLPCISAIGLCEEWQEAVNGICSDCNAGKVSVRDDVTNVTTHVACTTCPAGYVRSNADGTALGPCVPAVNHCEVWEEAVQGMCTTCFRGQVSVVDNTTQQPTHERCEFCAMGLVRSNANGNGLGPCVPAEGHCEPWQLAATGICTDCSAGMVTTVNSTTQERTFLSCDYCPNGMVRSSADGSARGVCVPAGDYCQSWQYATQGKCQTCETGMESFRDGEQGNYTFEFCAFCPDGQVRSSRDGTAVGPCVSAAGYCESHEMATRGKCKTCADGQTTATDPDTLELDYTSCLYCPLGQVRSSADGMAPGPCVSAVGFCQPWEYAVFGRCNDCPLGQVGAAGADGTEFQTCAFCPVGQVRQSPDGRGEGPCISAYQICTPTQRALKGYCVNCLVGQTSSIGPNGEYDHVSCI